MGAMIPTMITGIRLSNSLQSAKKLVHELLFFVHESVTEFDQKAFYSAP